MALVSGLLTLDVESRAVIVPPQYEDAAPFSEGLAAVKRETPKSGRRNVPHTRRSSHEARCPSHVTLRAGIGVPSLRSERFLVPIKHALRAGTTERFRVLEFSIQKDHLHLLVEANGPTGFDRGLRGLAIRISRLAGC